MTNEVENLVKDMWERKVCKECRESRVRWKNKDFKDGHYSNMLLGFGYDDIEKIQTPIDVLIVAEGHSGKHWPENQEDFREVLNHLKGLYLSEKDETFHQVSIRDIIRQFNNKKIKWYFTDITKCYIFNDEDGENFNIAVGNCIKYFEKEINTLNPKIVLMLGSRVQNSIAEKIIKPNKIQPLKEKSQTDRNLKYVTDGHTYFLYSIFPSQRTCDLWIKEGNRERLIEVIEDICKK
jgi:hypothetical protein